MIEVRDLVKRYGDNLAVDHISFTIEKGKVYGFLGPNGAGKSTTMNMMTGYLGPTDGSVIIDGHDILEEPEEAKRHIGYLPEHPPLYMDMKVNEYVRFAAELKGVPKNQVHEAVEKALERCDIVNVRNRLISNLSKGYKQRVGIAQAIVNSPDVVILDEPTVGLDPKQILEIRALIRELGKQHTVIISSHILSEIQEMCDEILIIRSGKLIAQGSTESLKGKLGAPTLEITAKCQSQNEVRALLFTIPGITDAVCTGEDKEGEVTVSIRTGDDADVREPVFRAFAAAGIPLLMIKPVEFSLEHLFLELIEENKPAEEKKRKVVKKVIRVPVAEADGKKEEN